MIPHLAKPRAVLFDAAGTLLRLPEPVGETYARFARRHGITLDAPEADRGFRRAFQALGRPDYRAGADADAAERTWWKTLVRQVVPEADDETFAGYFEEVFAHYGTGEAWALYPDVFPTLREIRRRGLRLAVLSNFDQRLHPVLNALGIAEFFESVTLSGEHGVAKPDGRIFAAALAALELPPDACLHVGDDPTNDWQGASDAGLRVFRLNRPENGLTDVLKTIATPLKG